MRLSPGFKFYLTLESMVQQVEEILLSSSVDGGGGILDCSTFRLQKVDFSETGVEAVPLIGQMVHSCIIPCFPVHVKSGRATALGGKICLSLYLSVFMAS